MSMTTLLMLRCTGTWVPDVAQAVRGGDERHERVERAERDEAKAACEASSTSITGRATEPSTKYHPVNGGEQQRHQVPARVPLACPGWTARFRRVGYRT